MHHISLAARRHPRAIEFAAQSQADGLVIYDEDEVLEALNKLGLPLSRTAA